MLIKILLIFIASVVVSYDADAQVSFDGCQSTQLETLDLAQPRSTQLTSGVSTINLACSLSQPVVLSVPLKNIRSIWSQSQSVVSLDRLTSNQYSVIIPSGESRLSINIDTFQRSSVSFRLDSVTSFHYRTVGHVSTLSLFIGLCIALTIYVTMLGKGMRDPSFFAYSAYLTSVVIFFSLQEGVFNYGIWSVSWHNYVPLQYAFAGLIVASAVLFVSRLLELKLILNLWIYKAIWTVALAILTMGFALTMIPVLSSTSLGQIMGWSTLLLVFAIFIITGYATLQKVHTANIIFIALSFIFIAMVFRIWLTDVSPFLHRYALIVSTAIEAMLFAFAVSEKVRALEREKSNAYFAASQDSLCAVLNRRGWTMAVQRKLQRLQKRDGVVTLLYIDIDHFKQINDNFGHSVGDRALQTIAKIIRHQSREDDVVGRLGGDEFVVFSHAVNEQQAQRLTARFRNKLSQLELWLDGKHVMISASVGAITKSSNDADLTSMLDSADHSMYQQRQDSVMTS